MPARKSLGKQKVCDTALVAPGAAFSVPITLAMSGGVSVDALTFGVLITTNGGAPALTGRLAFTKDAAIDDAPFASAGGTSNSISVVWASLSSALGGTRTLGVVTGTIPAGAASGQSYTVVVTGVSAANGGGTNPVAVSAGSNGAINVAIAASPAVMVSPTPGGVLAGLSTTFTWNPGAIVSSYGLYFGTTQGAFDIQAVMTGSATSYAATLPANGATIYVRLWTLIAGAWQYNDYTYTEAATVKATMATPAQGSVLPGVSATFTWNPGAIVSSYGLYFGTTQGAYNVLAVMTGASTSYTATLPAPTGATLYVRLWSLIGGVWQYNDYTYTR